MALILMDGVSEPVFVSVDVLRPVFAVLASVNPALIEFGLDDEDAIDGNYNVVNLGAVPVAGEKKVVDDLVIGFGKPRQNGGNPFLSDFAFGRDEPEEQYDDYNCDYYEKNLHTLIEPERLCKYTGKS